MRRFACIALCASAIAGVAIAQAPSPNATSGTSVSSAAPSGQPPADPMICLTEQEIGSLFTHTVCHTRSDWAQIRRDSQDYVHDSMTHSGQYSPPGH